MVPKVGIEPTQLTLQPPQGCVSTNFTTSALRHNPIFYWGMSSGIADGMTAGAGKLEAS